MIADKINLINKLKALRTWETQEGYDLLECLIKIYNNISFLDIFEVLIHGIDDIDNFDVESTSGVGTLLYEIIVIEETRGNNFITKFFEARHIVLEKGETQFRRIIGGLLRKKFGEKLIIEFEKIGNKSEKNRLIEILLPLREVYYYDDFKAEFEEILIILEKNSI